MLASFHPDDPPASHTIPNWYLAGVPVSKGDSSPKMSQVFDLGSHKENIGTASTFALNKENRDTNSWEQCIWCVCAHRAHSRAQAPAHKKVSNQAASPLIFTSEYKVKFAMIMKSSFSGNCESQSDLDQRTL